MEERRIGRPGLIKLLDDLEGRFPDGATTVYSRQGGFQVQGPPAGAGGDALERLAAAAERSETGAIAFWSEDRVLAVLPPFPVEHDRTLAGWDASPLRELVAREYLLGVVLLRLGRFAVGVFRGNTLLTSKTDTRYVKGRHSAGGTSQKRFARIREKQIQEMYRKTCEVTQARLGPFEADLDYIFLGGEKFTLQGLVKACDYLRRLSPKIHGRVLNVREPRLRALEGAIEAVWESRVLSAGR